MSLRLFRYSQVLFKNLPFAFTIRGFSDFDIIVLTSPGATLTIGPDAFIVWAMAAAIVVVAPPLLIL